MEGYISQILRSVIDVHFLDADNKSQLPTINEVFTICRENGTVLIAEVQQHIVKRTVRAVAVDSTDGLRRHMKVVSSDNAISITVGEQIKGRLMNVTGENIDGMCPFDRMGASSIHCEPPKFDELVTSQEVLYTDIKVINLLESYVKGDKIGLFGNIFACDNLSHAYCKLATVGALAGMNLAGQLRSHLSICRNIGFTVEQLCDFRLFVTAKIGAQKAELLNVCSMRFTLLRVTTHRTTTKMAGCKRSSRLPTRCTASHQNSSVVV